MEIENWITSSVKVKNVYLAGLRSASSFPKNFDTLAKFLNQSAYVISSLRLALANRLFLLRKNNFNYRNIVQQFFFLIDNYVITYHRPFRCEE